MRWLLAIIVALALAGAAFVLSPYYALYSLARAVETRDEAALAERVNVRAVRASVARQLVTAYLTSTGRAEEAKGLRGQVVVGAGVSLADRMLAGYATPGDLLALIRQSGAQPGAADAPAFTAVGDRSAILANGWKLFAGSESLGFRVVSFGLPPDKGRAEQFRLQFRINSRLTWRLVGLQLPPAVEQRLVQEFIRQNPTQG